MHKLRRYVLELYNAMAGGGLFRLDWLAIEASTGCHCRGCFAMECSRQGIAWTWHPSEQAYLLSRGRKRCH